MYEIVVFDLDFTLWDCGTWIDHTTPPFYQTRGVVYDSTDTPLTLYPYVTEILKILTENSFQLAIASRTNAPDLAHQLLKMYQVFDYFHYKEIYPGDKTTHFSRIQADSGVAYKNMMFFDDEHRNIQSVSSLGVKSVFVQDGISKKLLTNYLEGLFYFVNFFMFLDLVLPWWN